MNYKQVNRIQRLTKTLYSVQSFLATSGTLTPVSKDKMLWMRLGLRNLSEEPPDSALEINLNRVMTLESLESPP